MVRTPHFAEPKRLVFRKNRFHVVVAAASLAALSSPAEAKDADPPAGSVIYIRDVPNRQAQLPGQPGKPDFVDAGPDELIMAATSLGLKPLTDEQQSAVNAPFQRLPVGPGAAAEGWAGMGLAAPDHAAPGAGAIERSGGLANGAVGGAVSQVASALSTVSDALAGPR